MSAPDGFSIYAGAGFITMDQSKRDHFQTDPLISIFQRFRTAGYHVFDGSCCQWDIKHAGQDFMRTIDADGTNSVESYNHRLKIFAILDSCLDVFRKCSCFYTAMQKASGTVRMHMLPDVVWIGNDSEMNPFMTFLGTLFLP